MGWSDGDIGLPGDRLASADVYGVEVCGERWGVYGQNVCRGGEGYGNTGWFGGDVRVIAIPVREGCELEEEGGVCEAWEIFQLFRGGKRSKVWLLEGEVLEEGV